MAISAQIQKLNNTHEAILDWLLLNPEKSLRECADHFGYTQAWLSTVINSDAFRVQYSKLRGDVHARVCADVPTRMTRISEIALDKLAEMVEKSEDADFILETSDKILNRMGYGPKAVVKSTVNNTQNNTTFLVSADDLALARQNFGQTITQEPADELTSVPAAAAISSGE